MTPLSATKVGTYSLALILGVSLGLLYIFIYWYKVRKIDYSPINTALLTTVAGANFIPAGYVIIYVIFGGINNCLPDGFGQLTRVSLVLGGVCSFLFSIVGVVKPFLDPPISPIKDNSTA